MVNTYRLEIEPKIDRAKAKFLAHDIDLLRVNSSERSMTHRLAYWLEDEFLGWNVDCEYNRRGGKDIAKRLALPNWQKKHCPDEDPPTAFPDIIVHHRTLGRRKNNLLVIEAKKDNGSVAFDEEKLTVFKNDPQYGYRHAVLLTFLTGSQPDIVFVPFLAKQPPR